MEHALYKITCGETTLLVGVYVDDLVTGMSTTEIARFKLQMKHLLNMSGLGFMSYYLGIEVQQKAQEILLSQSSYTAKILGKYGMSECNPCQTPIEMRLKLSKSSTSPLVDTTHYRSVVGSLRYLVNTRPDIAHAVGVEV